MLELGVLVVNTLFFLKALDGENVLRAKELSKCMHTVDHGIFGDLCIALNCYQNAWPKS